MLSTAIIWGVITKIANKMTDLSPLFNSLYYFANLVHKVTFRYLVNKLAIVNNFATKKFTNTKLDCTCS